MIGLHRTAILSVEVNRKCRPKNMTVQLLTTYTDPERHSAQRHKQTDCQTDGQMMQIADVTVQQCDRLIK